MSSQYDAHLRETAERIAKQQHPVLGDDLRHALPGTEKEAWQRCSELAERYDKGMCEAYREQIDTLLVFAGLFSAVVTAFTVESYQWLYTDAGDVSVALLTQIANAVSTATPVAPPRTSAVSESTAVRINAYWFLSLTLSLASALVAILAKQWIREYERSAGRTPPQALGIRQMKLQGLEAWHVSSVISSIPLLLQIALALFLVGIVELLWRLSIRAAIPATAAAALVAAFYLATTLLPSLQAARWYFSPGALAAQCPYKSPQSWLVMRGVLPCIASFDPRKLCHTQSLLHAREQEKDHVTMLLSRAKALLGAAQSWMAFDGAWAALGDAEAVLRPEFRYSALAWLKETHDHVNLPLWIWHCLWEGSRNSGSLTRRAERNVAWAIQADRNTPLSPPFLSAREESQLGPRSLMLVYACQISLPLDVTADLLCQTYESYARHSAGDNRNPNIDIWAAAWLGKLHAVDGPLSIDICERLFNMVRQMDPIALQSAFGHTLKTAIILIAKAEESTERGSLILAMSQLTCDWLQRSSELVPVSEDTGYDCLEVLGLSFKTIGCSAWTASSDPAHLHLRINPLDYFLASIDQVFATLPPSSAASLAGSFNSSAFGDTFRTLVTRSSPLLHRDSQAQSHASSSSVPSARPSDRFSLNASPLPRRAGLAAPMSGPQGQTTRPPKVTFHVVRPPSPPPIEPGSSRTRAASSAPL